MARKRKGAASKVAQVHVKQKKIEDVGDEPKAKRGRPSKEHKEVETSVVNEKRKRGRPSKEHKEVESPIVEEKMQKGYSVKVKKEETEKAKEAADIEDIVSKQPKRRGRSATVSEDSKPSEEEMRTKKGKAKPVAENEQVSKATNNVEGHPKRRGRSATVPQGLNSNNVTREDSSNSKSSKEKVNAAKEKVKTAKLIATEKAKAAKLVAKEKAKAAKLVAKEKAKSAKLAAKIKTAKLAAKMKARNKKATQNRRGWFSDEVNVFEFTVTLEDTSPKIWRKFQVLSTFTFAELHNAIHNCMGWLSCHMHEFSMLHPKTRKLQRIGRSFDSIMEINYPDVVNERETKIEDYFTEENKNATYIYDWGDNWDHTITLDRIFPIKSKATYPNCVSGKCACPPEDVGGIDGFYNFVEIIKNPEHPEYEDMRRWIDEDGGYPHYDPDHFDPKEVVFEYTYVIG